MSIFVRSPKIRLATVKRGKLHNPPAQKMKGMSTFLGSFSRETLILSNEAFLLARRCSGLDPGTDSPDIRLTHFPGVAYKEVDRGSM
jgi:hypothetical protein